MAYKENKYDEEHLRIVNSGKFFKKRCSEKKIKSKILEERFGVSRDTVRRWKQGTSGIAPSVAGKLTKLLDAPLCEILGIPQDCCQKCENNIKLSKENERLKCENEALKKEIRQLKD